MRRSAEWEAASLGGRLLKAPHGHEWLALVARWREGPGEIAFVADPLRTDLALFDPHARRLLRAYRWPFIEPPFVGGARPGAADWYVMRQPGWMLDKGWALTAEIAGVTARDRLGPHVRPSVAWVRARPDEALLLLGGRHLGAAGDAPAVVTVSVGGRAVDSFQIAAGPFFHLVPLPAGTLHAANMLMPLEVTATGTVPVALEQFDLQSAGIAMMGVQEGWQEPEYNPVTGRSWRWMSERAVLWVRPVGRDVTLTLTGESPLRYFDSAPLVRVSANGSEVARFQPSSDFEQAVRIPAGALAAANGQVVIESDKWFSPGDRDGSADRRRLALRIYQARQD